MLQATRQHHVELGHLCTCPKVGRSICILFQVHAHAHDHWRMWINRTHCSHVSLLSFLTRLTSLSSFSSSSSGEWSWVKRPRNFLLSFPRHFVFKSLGFNCVLILCAVNAHIPKRFCRTIVWSERASIIQYLLHCQSWWKIQTSAAELRCCSPHHCHHKETCKA